jgi:hypothetical protein
VIILTPGNVADCTVGPQCVSLIAGIKKLLGDWKRYKRRERRGAREGEPRAFERQIAQINPHRAWLRDLLDVIEIARGTVPVSDAATEGSAGEEAAGDLI